MSIRITANGKPYDLADDLSVAGFLHERGLDPKYVVVEHNGEPLERRSYERTRLHDGDRLELVRAVAGGAPEARRERLERARLYVVSDARRERGDLAGFLDTVLGAGVEIIQLREKNAEAGDLLRWGEVFGDAAARHGALFIVNDRPDVALALGADGVHLGQNDLPPGVARSILGPEVIIGLSTHTAAEADAAAAEADYVTAGPVWETPTKPGRPAAGLQHVRHVAARERRPWFAIGGIKPENLAGVVEAGARRIAVVRAVTDAADPAGAVRQLLEGLPKVSGARS